MRAMLVCLVLVAGCMPRISAIDDGKPVFINLIDKRPDLNEDIIPLVYRGAALWEDCGVRYTLQRSQAAHVIDVVLFEHLANDGHAGEWYTDGISTRIQFGAFHLRKVVSAPDYVIAMAAHEFGHAYVSGDHLDTGTDAVMAAPLSARNSLSDSDFTYVRDRLGKLCTRTSLQDGPSGGPKSPL